MADELMENQITRNRGNSHVQTYFETRNPTLKRIGVPNDTIVSINTNLIPPQPPASGLSQSSKKRSNFDDLGKKLSPEKAGRPKSSFDNPRAGFP
jgi:hypothetical protein